ncbi:MAG TPA: serine acetyltransferase [Bacteroidales bacterium]|nr:serine acetyltransferase [Bacteroidales bacterium]
MIIPDKKEVEIAVDNIFKFLFPYNDITGNLNPDDVLKSEISAIIIGLTSEKLKINQRFSDNLPSIKKTLLSDAEFILDSDPAARDLAEVIAIYPGFFAIYCYRIAHVLHQLSIPILPRMITEYAHKTTGIDIHPGAKIDSPVSIDHGTGIVIGETAIIGNHVKLFQGVTLGALSVSKSKASRKRHPTIEDNVILYSGCTILGGHTIIGRNSIIGGNVWLTESIAPFSVVYHKSEIIVKNNSRYHEPIDFMI